MRQTLAVAGQKRMSRSISRSERREQGRKRLARMLPAHRLQHAAIGRCSHSDIPHRPGHRCVAYVSRLQGGTLVLRACNFCFEAQQAGTGSSARRRMNRRVDRLSPRASAAADYPVGNSSVPDLYYLLCHDPAVLPAMLAALSTISRPCFCTTYSRPAAG